MKYSFFERDFFSNDGNCYFSEEHYAALLAFCFQKSSVFSLQYATETQLTREMSKWEIDNPNYPYQNETKPTNRHYYCANNLTHTFLLSISTSIFDFYYSLTHEYPEDLVFYRKDGSVLLDSIAHEGECNIYPNSAEDVSQIIMHGHWMYMEGGSCFEEGVPVVPAKDHQLPCNTRWNLFDDPFYKILNDIYVEPLQFIYHPDITHLLSYINGYLSGVSSPVGWNLPPSAPPYIPTWWIAFKLYILGSCNANTNDSIIYALKQAGLEGESAYNHFFAQLHSFADNYSNWLLNQIEVE